MPTHPNVSELSRIRLTRLILTLLALATVGLIVVLAIRGNYRKAGYAVGSETSATLK
jgi:hypothetical protein